MAQPCKAAAIADAASNANPLHSSKALTRKGRVSTAFVVGSNVRHERKTKARAAGFGLSARWSC